MGFEEGHEPGQSGQPVAFWGVGLAIVGHGPGG
jgi:hypothetical protein